VLSKQIAVFFNLDGLYVQLHYFVTLFSRVASQGSVRTHFRVKWLVFKRRWSYVPNLSKIGEQVIKLSTRCTGVARSKTVGWTTGRASVGGLQAEPQAGSRGRWSGGQTHWSGKLIVACTSI